MTVGTEGNDQLTNDTSKVTETVSALGGDDVVTINPPRVISSSADIGVDGGTGYDILVASGLQFRAFANSGLDGSLAVRDSSLFNYFVTWTGIEELHLDGELFQPGTYSLGGTVDILHLSTTFSGSYLLQTNGGNDQIYWQSSSSGTAITIDAGAGNDLIDFTGANLGTRTGQGGDGNDTLIGSGGADRLEGGNGDDVIDGKVGGDTMLGGAGNDLYYVDNAGDTITENANEGTDEVRTTLAAYALTANVETLTGLLNSGQALTGNGLDNHITGGSGNDTLTGGDGNDILDGGAGADAMAGGLGNDVYYVDDAGDTVTENSGEGTDEIRTSLASYTLGADIENLTGLVAGQTLNGNALNNVITGAPGNATLHGGSGDDVLKVTNPGFAQVFGDTGNDTLVADLSGATGDVGTLGGPSAGSPDGTYVVYAGGGVRVDADGIENFNIKTGSGNDSIYMAGGNDTADLGAGDDVLLAGAGAIVADGGDGIDGINVDFSGSTGPVAINLQTGALTGVANSSIVNFEYFQVFGTAHGLTTGSGDDVVVTTSVAKSDNIATGAGTTL